LGLGEPTPVVLGVLESHLAVLVVVDVSTTDSRLGFLATVDDEVLAVWRFFDLDELVLEDLEELVATILVEASRVSRCNVVSRMRRTTIQCYHVDSPGS
jgi:hypothetical protein